MGNIPSKFQTLSIKLAYDPREINFDEWVLTFGVNKYPVEFNYIEKLVQNYLLYSEYQMYDHFLKDLMKFIFRNNWWMPTQLYWSKQSKSFCWIKIKTKYLKEEQELRKRFQEYHQISGFRKGEVENQNFSKKSKRKDKEILE